MINITLPALLIIFYSNHFLDFYFLSFNLNLQFRQISQGKTIDKAGPFNIDITEQWRKYSIDFKVFVN